MLLSGSKCRSMALQLLPEGRDAEWQEQELVAPQHSYQRKKGISEVTSLRILSGGVVGLIYGEEPSPRTREIGEDNVLCRLCVLKLTFSGLYHGV